MTTGSSLSILHVKNAEADMETRRIFESEDEAGQLGLRLACKCIVSKILAQKPCSRERPIPVPDAFGRGPAASKGVGKRPGFTSMLVMCVHMCACVGLFTYVLMAQWRLEHFFR